MKLQPKQSFWTPHVGLVSFSDDFFLTQIPTPTTDRILLCKIHHPHNFFDPFYILNIYAPAGTNGTTQRKAFYNSVLGILESLDDTIDISRLLILGDFNYSYHRSNLHTATSLAWTSFLEEGFYNCMLKNDLSNVPTFERRSQNTQSTIDFIFAGQGLSSLLVDTSLVSVNPKWTDHCMLSASFNMGLSLNGPGLWRANPQLAQDPSLHSKIQASVSRILETFDLDDQDSAPQALWDTIKQEIKQVIQQHGIQRVAWRHSTLKMLQRKRNRFLRGRPSVALRSMVLPSLDTAIFNLQQELVDVMALRAGVRWRENSERSPTYLKKIHSTRSHQQFMATLRTGPENDTPTTDQTTMRSCAQAFYQHLYTIDPVDENEIDRYLSSIRIPQQLSTEDGTDLMAPITISELQQQATRVSPISSPGDDGLGYPFVSLLFSMKTLQPLILKIYNDALNLGLFPRSWQSLRVRLLPKKNDLSLLKNWRPISLINCDAKVYTRLLTRRLATKVSGLFNMYQTGFLPGRFIAANGLALKLIMEQANAWQIGGVGLLLDQEKAYDRVHPVYLQKVLTAFGIPHDMVTSIINLFFKNRVAININGFFTDDVDQRRGLRQGDPLSPLLFNMALEPLLLSILQDPQITGFVSPTAPDTHNLPPLPLKCLAYADDVCVLLSSQHDFHRLQHHLHRYASVSNAKFNQDKTECFSLNGSPDAGWQQLLDDHHITTYHHARSTSPFRYLGFLLSYTTQQRNHALQRLLGSIRHHITTFSTRRLSIQGRTTIANSLLLPKLWYSLRLLHTPQQFIGSLRTMMAGFVWQQRRPLLPYAHLCRPKAEGGVGLFDPGAQQLTLQVRWIRAIIDPESPSSFIRPLLLHHLALIPGCSYTPLAPLLFPAFRKGPLCHTLSTLSLIFKAYDKFDFGIDLRLLSTATCLGCPLSIMFTAIPCEHWLLKAKYRHLRASTFFTFDDTLKRMRILVPSEFPTLPRLLRQLYHQVLHGIVKIAPAIWDRILQVDGELGTVSLEPLTDAFQSDPLWYHDSPTKIRFKCRLPLRYLTPTFADHSIKLFWLHRLDPQARTVWYRYLVNRIPLRRHLQYWGISNSSLCHLCNRPEDLYHISIGCSHRTYLWNVLIITYLPPSITAKDIYDTITSLTIPLDIADPARYFGMIGTMLHLLWRAHWDSSRNGTPIDADKILHSFITRIPNIISKPSLEYE